MEACGRAHVISEDVAQLNAWPTAASLPMAAATIAALSAACVIVTNWSPPLGTGTGCPRVMRSKKKLRYDLPWHGP